MVAAVVVAAVVGLVGERRADSSAPIPAATPHSGSVGDLFDADEPAPTGETSTVHGRVREVIDVAEYTYLRLATPNGEVWAAVSKAPITVDSEVTVENPTRMDQFTSSTLKRTFDVIYFGNLRAAGSTPPSALPAGHPSIDGQGSSPLAHGAPSPASENAVDEVNVPRASGRNAHTIGEVFAQRAELAGKLLRVRGQVVKLTPGILGKSYLRLRDGSSSRPDEHELVVTTQAEPRVGDVSTFEGTLQTDVDVGIGYKYLVLLGDARLVADPLAKAL